VRVATQYASARCKLTISSYIIQVASCSCMLAI